MFVTTSPPKLPRLSQELLEHYRTVSLQPFTVIDVVTTGSAPSYEWLSPPGNPRLPQVGGDRVIEVAIVIADLKSGIQAQYTQLINAEFTISYNLIRFTGITQPMLDYSPLATQVWTEYLPLFNQGILTAHHLSADYHFLQAEYKRLKIAFARPATSQLCTMELAKLLLPDLPSFRLPALARYLGFKVDESHRAAPNALACWMLTQKLLTQVQQESREKLLERLQSQWIDLRQAASILGCTETEAQIHLVKAGLRSRSVGRYGELLYQRGNVELARAIRT